MSAVTIAEIKAILCEVYNRSHDVELKPQGVTDDERLFDYDGTGADHLDFDSLDGLEVTAYLEDKYGIIAPGELDPRDLATPRNIASFVTRLLEQHAS